MDRNYQVVCGNEKSSGRRLVAVKTRVMGSFPRTRSFRAIKTRTSPSFDGSKTSAGGEGLKQTAGWVHWVTCDFACFTTQPSAVEGSDGWQYVLDNNGGLPNYTF